jgi:hypothetical protein
MTRPIRWITGSAAAAATALALIVPAAGATASVSAAADPEFYAAMHGSSAFPNARGHSEYERTSTQREVDVTLNNAPNRIRRHNVVVFVNRKRVGTMWVNRFGHAEREWSTEHRQYVPWAGSGSPVRVRTTGGTLVISGYYHLETDD